METPAVKQTLEFRTFAGPTHHEMQKLIASGLVPANAAEIMRSRLDGKLDWKTYYDSGDAIVYHPDGSVKLVYNSKDLRELNPTHELRLGSMVLPNSAWNTMKGVVFPRGHIERFTNYPQPKNEVKENPVWQWFARYNPTLLDSYVDAMFSHVKEGYGYDTAMGIYLSSTNSQNRDTQMLHLRVWCLGGVYRISGGAIEGNLDGKNGHLVGLRETRSAVKQARP